MTKPFERAIVLDLETAWGRAVKLGFSCQTMEEYIRDPRFKAWGLSWKELGGDEPAVWVTRKDLPAFFKSIDWSTTAVMAQNAGFDVSIMGWHYNAHPAFIMDTLSMGRALRGVEVGNSLAKLAKDLGLPPKGDGLSPSENILDELPADVERVLAEYCCHDTWLCEQIFFGLGGWDYPKSELRLIDMTLKMYTRPQLELDSKMLIKALTEEGEAREGLLQRLGIQETSLASNPQFATILESLGVAAPTKISKTTGKPTLALAKNDALFQAMLNGEREDVALLCEARLRVKSTTERTRAQRFLDISQRGKLPVPLSYYGALSGRWTAAKGSAINMQNLKRGSFLRKAIMAPEGYQLVVGDLSQIEPRVLAWLSDYQDMLDIFRAGGDPYAAFGAQMFNIPGLSKDSHPDLRQSAKSALLGCGYGLGWASFASQLLTGFLGAPPVRYEKAFAKTLGVDQEYAQKFVDWEDNVTKMLAIPHTCTDQELLTHCLAAKKIIDIYRATAHPVATFWDMCSNLIESSLYGGKVFQYKCLTFSKERIELPNGMSLLYPELRREKDDKGRSQWVYGPNATKLYAGKVTNNCLAEGTLVLTSTGWVPIEGITTQHLVHDGLEFVEHTGKIFNGVQTCVTLFGVQLTPDHKVLTHAGWQEASQVQRPYRPDLRHIDGASARLVYRQGVAVAASVPVREEVCEIGVGHIQRSKTRGNTQLRMFDKAANRQEERYARYEPSPRIHRVAQHAKSLHQTFRACVQELRRTGHNGLQALGKLVRDFLGGYGGHVCAGVGARPQEQRRLVLAGELSLDFPAQQHYEQAQHRAVCGRAYTEQANRNTSVHNLLSAQTQLASNSTDARTRCEKPVYDIVNCGPRNRFVVLGEDGPFVVHNCVQAVARIVMTDGMLRVTKKYPVVGTVHDEQIVLVPDEEVASAKTWVLEQMTMEPRYMPGIPLAADGGAHRRYGEAKQ